MNVTYQGGEFSVPEWAQFIAADDSGDVCAYEARPEYSAGEQAYSLASRGRAVTVGRIENPKVRELQCINKE